MEFKLKAKIQRRRPYILQDKYEGLNVLNCPPGTVLEVIDNKDENRNNIGDIVVMLPEKNRLLGGMYSPLKTLKSSISPVGTYWGTSIGDYVFRPLPFSREEDYIKDSIVNSQSIKSSHEKEHQSG